jgi:hypothetical protein
VYYLPGGKDSDGVTRWADKTLEEEVAAAEAIAILGGVPHQWRRWLQPTHIHTSQINSTLLMTDFPA